MRECQCELYDECMMTNAVQGECTAS